MNLGTFPPMNESVADEDQAQSMNAHKVPGSSTSPSSHGLPHQVKNHLLGTQNAQSPSSGNRAPKNEQLHQAKLLISPLNLIRTAGEQILGTPTPEEQQKRQSEILQSQQRMAQERQQLDTFRQKQTIRKQQQGQANAALAEQASAFTNKPVTHVGTSQTEQNLLEKIIADGQVKQATQQSGATLPSSPAKGPNMGNTQPKTDMMAAMQPDRPKAKKSEPAAHELPLGE